MNYQFLYQLKFNENLKITVNEKLKTFCTEFKDYKRLKTMNYVVTSNELIQIVMACVTYCYWNNKSNYTLKYKIPWLAQDFFFLFHPWIIKQRFFDTPPSPESLILDYLYWNLWNNRKNISPVQLFIKIFVLSSIQTKTAS